MGTLSVDKLVKTSSGAAEFTLPATDGTAGQVLQTDGSGQLSVAALAADTVTATQIAANAVTSSEIADDAVTSAKLANTLNITSGNSLTIDSGATITNSGTATGFGKVLQVVSSMYKGTNSTSSNSMTSTGLEATITPSATSSKILIMTSFAMAATGDAGVWIQLFKGSSVISGSLADVQGSRRQASVGCSYSGGEAKCFNYLDSPSTTSATTYELMYAVSPGRPSSTIYMNLMTQTNANYYSTSPATMILMEIAG